MVNLFMGSITPKVWETLVQITETMQLVNELKALREVQNRRVCWLKNHDGFAPFMSLTVAMPTFPLAIAVPLQQLLRSTLHTGERKCCEIYHQHNAHMSAKRESTPRNAQYPRNHVCGKIWLKDHWGHINEQPADGNSYRSLLSAT